MNVPSDLVCVTSYFNPARVERRRENYEVFRRAMCLPLVTIECAFGDASFELPDAATTLRVRASDIMWQKERLLNIAVTRLPANFTKVAWVDADVVFDNPDWAWQASRLLDRCEVVQLFEHSVRLAPSRSAREVSRGFAATCAEEPPPLNPAFCSHGHPGLAWAAQRELLEQYKLYDACIAGGGDDMIAHALYGWHELCIPRYIRGSHFDHYKRWATAVHARICGHVGFIPGTIYDHWHGSPENRLYFRRHQVLANFGFDPSRHLATNSDGCWKWTNAPQELRDWVVKYFANRREDEL